MTFKHKTIHLSDPSGRFAMQENLLQGTDTFAANLSRYIYSNHIGSASLELDDNASIISYEEYHPYGTTAYTASNASIKACNKRYKFVGKEKDEESGLYYMNARYYAPWLCRWISTDPILSHCYNIQSAKPARNAERHFLELTASGYEYCYDNPVRFVDESGEQAVDYSWFYKYLWKEAGITGQTEKEINRKIQEYKPSPQTEKILNGVMNTTFGVVGTVASIVYMGGTLGVGAAFGGAAALTLSLGEIGIGVSQIVEASTSNNDKNEILHKSSSIPGLIAYGTKNQYAPFIDALGQFSPTIFTSGRNVAFLSMKGLWESKLGVLEALKDLKNSPSVFNALNVWDAWSDFDGFRIESVELFNTVKSTTTVDQKANLTFSYTVQSGDTVSELAKRFNATEAAVIKAYKIDNPKNLQTGAVGFFNSTASGTISN